MWRSPGHWRRCLRILHLWWTVRASRLQTRLVKMISYHNNIQLFRINTLHILHIYWLYLYLHIYWYIDLTLVSGSAWIPYPVVESLCFPWTYTVIYIHNLFTENIDLDVLVEVVVGLAGPACVALDHHVGRHEALGQGVVAVRVLVDRLENLIPDSWRNSHILYNILSF